MAVPAIIGPALSAGGRLLGGIWRNLPGIAAIGKEIGKSVPHLENEATVEVLGQPGANKKDLYFLALATAFGLVGRSDISFFVGQTRFYVAPPPGLLMVEYDAADNWVRATVKYRTSTLTAVTEAALGNRVTAFYQETALYSGPDDFVTGRPFNFTTVNLIPGIPNSAQSAGAPQLPFAGRDVLTAHPSVFDPNPALPLGTADPIASPNPKPPGDNRSRGVAVVEPNPGSGVVQNRLVPLVFAALSDPGTATLQVFPPPTSGPLGS